jgi:fermentation-respiration switch protein FrsA (DUF1100 family)
VTLHHPLIRIPLWILAIYVGVCLLVYLVQRRMMYFPDPDPVVAEPGMENVALETDDGVRVMATWWPATRPLSILLLHGNAGNRGHRFDWMRTFHDLGWNVFLLDYRGYGGSEGTPTQRGLGQDGDAAVAWLSKQRPGDAIVYFGESIGGSVAIDVATRHRPAGLVLQSCAYDLTEVGRKHYPWLPLGLILKDDWNSRGKIEKLDVPLFSLHGARDSIVPQPQGRAIFDASPTVRKEWWSVEDAGHNDLPGMAGDDYYLRVHRFLESVAKR